MRIHVDNCILSTTDDGEKKLLQGNVTDRLQTLTVCYFTFCKSGLLFVIFLKLEKNLLEAFVPILPILVLGY
jgi:hypothetical protein